MSGYSIKFHEDKLLYMKRKLQYNIDTINSLRREIYKETIDINKLEAKILQAKKMGFKTL